MIANAGAVLGLLFTIAGLFGQRHYIPEIFTQVKIPLTFCFAGYIVLKIISGNQYVAVLAIVPLLINAAPLIMLFVPQQRCKRPHNPIGIRILQANLLTSNRNAQRVLDLIDSVDPDVIVLQETGSRWLSELEVLKTRYPVYAEHPREDNFGAAIFCRNINAVASIEFLSDPDRLPVSRVVIPGAGRDLTIYGVHPLAPLTADLWKQRNQYTLEMAKKMSQTDGQIIVTGDMNNAPWTHYFKQFIEISGLLDASQGRGPLPTWPAWLPMLPLDHCFHSAGVIIKKRWRAPRVGSDHYPLVIEAHF